jgi:hypothetical protein
MTTAPRPTKPAPPAHTRAVPIAPESLAGVAVGKRLVIVPLLGDVVLRIVPLPAVGTTATEVMVLIDESVVMTADSDAVSELSVDTAMLSEMDEGSASLSAVVEAVVAISLGAEVALP